MRIQANPFTLTFPSDWTFFGLTLDYNQKVYDQIFDLAFYGQGGFPYSDLVAMPVNLRAFYYTKMADIIEQRNKAIAEANEKAARRK